MPTFEPFAGLRYDDSAVDLDAVVAPPYDVIDDPDRERLEASDPHNAVRLILPRDRRDEGDRYGAAAATLDEWRSAGILVRDPGPRFYTYRMRYPGPDGRPAETLGVLGAMGLPPAPGEGDVLPHERTLPKAKSDRLALLAATRANLDPIWALSLAPGLSDLLAGSSPLVAARDPDAVEHEVGVLTDSDTIAAISAAVAAVPAVLADGHHRFETACTYRDRQAAAGDATAGTGAILTLAVELADHQLCIRAIHRLVAGTGADRTRHHLARWFDVHPLDGSSADVATLLGAMDELGGPGVVDPEGMAVLVPRDALRTAAAASWPAPAASSDAALVETAIADALADATVSYRDDAAACARLVGAGTHNAALLLRPITVAQTRAAAEAGVRMPQKTTFFWPKPRTGLVFRLLD